ncbi:uncharacterized protein [Asterias amurensis]|uniref:uncharacterized protein n=1 Tax=Asterias amurensis TaxID=7602 RepID=UPI003AB462FA
MSPAMKDYEDSNESEIEGLGVVRGPNITTAHFSHGASRFHRYLYLHTRTADDVVILVVIIASVIGVASAIALMFGLWQSKRQHRRLAKVVEMDSDDFLLYARVAQKEDSSTPCRTSIPCQMPGIGGNSVTSYIAPGYVSIVQLTHPAKEQNPKRKPHRSVERKTHTDENKSMYNPSDGNLPKSTTSAPAILRGLWQQRHLLTGRGDTLVDSFTNLKKPAWQHRVRTSLSDTAQMINRPGSGQSLQSICQECGSGLTSLAGGGKFPRNISCRLCRQRAGIRDVTISAKTNYSIARQQDVSPTQPQSVEPSITTPSHHSPGRPKLSTFQDRRRKSCTAEIRAQLDPFRTMVTLSSSSEDSTSDSD